MKQNIHFFLYQVIIFLTLISCSKASDDAANPIFNDSYTASSYGSQVLLRINSDVFENINTNRLNSINTGD